MQQIDIVNIALTRLGMATITGMTEGSAEAAAAEKVWEVSLSSVLQEARWGFNVRRSALALCEENPAGYPYTHAYAAPSDLLQPYGIFTPDSTAYGRTPFIYEGGRIMTDVQDAVLIYGAYMDRVSAFSARFCDALAWRLAMELAGKLTQRASLLEYATTQYKAVLTGAKAVAGNAQHPGNNTICTYIRARG